MYCGNHGNYGAMSVKAARCNVSQPQADGRSSVGIKSQMDERKGAIRYGRFLSYLLLCLTCFSVFSLPVVMGSFEEGERSQSVSQGEGAVIPAPRIRSFPQPQVTWYRDGRKIPPSNRM